NPLCRVSFTLLLCPFDLFGQGHDTVCVHDQMPVFDHCPEDRGELPTGPLPSLACPLEISSLHCAVVFEVLPDEGFDLVVDGDAPCWESALDAVPHPVKDRDRGLQVREADFLRPVGHG